jgi:hypothetical protein
LIEELLVTRFFPQSPSRNLAALWA